MITTNFVNSWEREAPAKDREKQCVHLANTPQPPFIPSAHCTEKMRTGHSCNSCSKTFTTAAGLISHCRAKNHTANSASKPPKHHRCSKCSRQFGTASALSQHQKALAHRGLDFKCCKRKFKSPSGIAMHIESGFHKVTRHHVTAAVHALNIVPNITIKKITGPVCPPILCTYIATEASFNGSAYECYICRKSFRTLASLNGHLNSPAHDDDEFRCPKCKTQFKLISGFVQHLESGCCGLAKPTQIDNHFKKLTGKFSRLLTL